MSPVLLTDQQSRQVAVLKVFFAHQSVGDNIVQGIRDLMAEDSRLQLKIISSDDPVQVAGPALVETHVGQNTNPRSKNVAFLTILGKGFGAQGGVALLKYCYVDVGPATDVPRMFREYADLIADLRSKYPALKIVHSTLPLTTVEPAGKAWLKEVLGRPTTREDNRKRNQFNQMLRGTYGPRSIFDLAEVESTHADGSREFFVRGNQKIYTLAPEYTGDGGHLNELGRRAAAHRLLITLANL